MFGSSLSKYLCIGKLKRRLYRKINNLLEPENYSSDEDDTNSSLPLTDLFAHVTVTQMQTWVGVVRRTGAVTDERI